MDDDDADYMQGSEDEVPYAIAQFEAKQLSL
jgi:hypothetical protein